MEHAAVVLLFCFVAAADFFGPDIHPSGGLPFVGLPRQHCALGVVAGARQRSRRTHAIHGGFRPYRLVGLFVSFGHALQTVAFQNARVGLSVLRSLVPRHASVNASAVEAPLLAAFSARSCGALPPSPFASLLSARYLQWGGVTAIGGHVDVVCRTFWCFTVATWRSQGSTGGIWLCALRL